MSTVENYREGVAAAQAGDFERADTLLAAAAQQSPNDARIWLWRAACASNADGAMPFLRRALGVVPDHAVARRALGTLLVARGAELVASNRPAARDALIEACGLVSENTRAWLLLRDACDDEAERLAHTRRAAATLPASEEIRSCLRDDLVRRAVTASRVNRRDDAREALREAVVVAPLDVQLWLALAHVSEVADAIVALRSALDVAPGHGGALAALTHILSVDARALAERGDRGAARRRWLEVIAIDRTSPDVWVELAEVGQSPEESVQCLETALSLSPRHEAAMAALAERTAQAGIDAFQAGDRDRAIRFLRRSVGLVPANARAWKALAELSTTTAARIECFRRVIALEPGHSRVAGVLASLLVQEASTRAAAGDQAEAVSIFREVVTLDPKSIEGWWGLACTARAREESIQAIERVLEIDPSHDMAQELKQRLSRAPTPQAVAPPEPPAPEATPDAPADSRQVLVVDDSPTVRKALTLMLERAGHRVTAAADGESALAALDASTPDLVFLDITMPKMDGYEVCRRIRKRSDLAQLPVVMLSGKDGFFDKVRGQMAGASEYITKPFEPPAVLAAVAEHCTRSRPAAR